MSDLVKVEFIFPVEGGVKAYAPDCFEQLKKAVDNDLDVVVAKVESCNKRDQEFYKRETKK